MYEDEQQQRERLSALVDGQLDHTTFTHTMDWLASSREARTTWHAYHVFGDALRDPGLPDCGRDQAFLDRFRVRLAQSGPTNLQDKEAGGDVLPVQASARLVPVGSVETVVAPANAVQVANDAVLRWQWLAAVASLMTVAVLGWHVSTVSTPQQGESVIASAATPGGEPQVMLRDPRLDELLAAHRQFGGTSALQMPTGFLRNATFEPPAR